MRSETSRHEYERGLNLVKNHIAEYLDEPLPLDFCILVRPLRR